MRGRQVPGVQGGGQGGVLADRKHLGDPGQQFRGGTVQHAAFVHAAQHHGAASAWAQGAGFVQHAGGPGYGHAVGFTGHQHGPPVAAHGFHGQPVQRRVSWRAVHQHQVRPVQQFGQGFP